MLKNPQQKRHFMEKSEYVNLLESKPWQEMEDTFNDLSIVPIRSTKQFSINTQDWIDFSIDNFELASHKWEEPKSHYSDDGKKWNIVNNILGRNKHNSFELSYGMLGDGNKQIVDLLGLDNISILGVDPKTVLMKLIVKFPGHGMAWHRDYWDSYILKFPNCDPTKLKRYWFSVADWQDGHVFQVSKTMISHWKKGDIFEIPFGLGHASSNFGYSPMFTVSFTGYDESFTGYQEL